MKKFEKVYEEVIKKDSQKFVSQRKLLYTLIVIMCIIGINLIVAVTLEVESVAINAGAIFLILLLILIISLTKEYTKKYKEQVIFKFLKQINETFKIYPEKSIDKKEYEKSGFKSGNQITSNDLIEGKLENNLKVQMADIIVRDKRVNEAGEQTILTLFSGLFVVVELNKSIEKPIKLLADQKKLGKRNLKIDHTEFEKHYDIFSENSLQAYQLYTADIMDKILEFKSKNKIYPEIIVNKNKLYIRIAVDGLFEPTLFDFGFDKETLKKYYEIIKLINEISNHLLNTILDEIL